MTHASRLDTIAARQRKSLARDLAFAALVALATVVGVTSVAAAASAANPNATDRCAPPLHIAQR